MRLATMDKLALAGSIAGFSVAAILFLVALFILGSVAFGQTLDSEARIYEEDGRMEENHETR